MSKLQNNFTTPKQSKRLLELGVPAWTADFFYPTKKSDMPIIIVDIKVGYNLKYAIPCWSVGRLMQIFAICFDPDFIHFDTFADGINFLQQMMDKFETYAENIDFSKLEE